MKIRELLVAVALLGMSISTTDFVSQSYAAEDKGHDHRDAKEHKGDKSDSHNDHDEKDHKHAEDVSHEHKDGGHGHDEDAPHDEKKDKLKSGAQ